MRLGLGLGIVKSAASIYKGILDKFPNAVAAYSTRKLKTSYPTTLPADYGGGAAAAYSLRKVKSDYEGSAVRVRKAVSSVSEETDIGFDANGNLDTATLLSFASDADNGDVFVSIWYDQSGNDNRATNTQASEQPLVVSGGSLVTENGKAAIEFDGSDMLVASGFSGSSIQDSYFVMNYQDDSNAMWMHDLYTNNPNRYAPYVRDGESSSPTQGYGTPSYYVNGSAVTITTRTEAYNEFSNSKGQILRVDEGANTSTWQDISFGLWYTSYGYNGNVQEIIIFNSDQSTNRKDIEWNINNHYSIYDQWDRESCMNVRRSSDNATQDIGFSGKNINQTQLESFVNDASPVLDDYTGDNAAAAAYSLRKIRTAYTGSAINVRRSSDGTSQDIGFDSNGNLDTTTLLAFVNAEYTLADEDFSSSTGWTLGAGVSITGGVLRANTSGSSIYAYKDFGDTGAQQVRVTFTISNYVSGNVRYSNFGAVTNGTSRSANGTYTEVLTLQEGGNSNHGFIFNGSFVGDIDDFEVVQITADGHVTTWYDQSGNGNNATNSTESEQPLIVSGGTLVTENGKAAIDYNSSGYLLANFSGTLTQPNSIFSVCKKNDHSNYLFDGIALGTNRHAQGNGTWIYAGSVLNGAFPNADLGNQLIFTALFNGASSEAFIDGSLTATGDAGSQSLTGLTLGRYYDLTASVTPLNGTMQELIIFNSDQSTTRLSIEGNIGRYYNITGYRDGFVTKWYDQSGEYNHAENSTSDEQPQIVSNGSMLEENGKPAILSAPLATQNLLRATFTLPQPLSIIGVVKTPLDRDQVPISSQNTILRVYRRFNTSDNFLIQAGYNVFTGSQNLEQSLEFTVYNGSSGIFALNGSLLTTADFGTNGLDNLDLFQSNGSLPSYETYLQEVIVFASDQSGNRTDIEKNINTHFKIYS